MSETVYLFSAEEVLRLRKKEKKWKRAVRGLAAAALLVCVLLCAGVNTGNAEVREKAVIAVSTAAGWVCIFLSAFGERESRRSAAYADAVLSGEPEKAEGEVSLTGEKVKLPSGVRARRVRVKGADGEKHFLIHEAAAAGLAEAAQAGPLALETRRGYVAAYGPAGEEAAE